MEILYLLIPVVLLGIAIAMRFLFWAIRSGQYDDLEKESQRILFDDPDVKQTINDSSEPHERAGNDDSKS